MATWIPTIAAGAALGTAPPAIVVSGIPGDEWIQLTFGSGTAPAIGVALTITFAGDWASLVALQAGATPLPVPVITPQNQVTQALGLYVSSFAQDNLVISCTVAPGISQSNSTYVLAFAVVF